MESFFIMGVFLLRAQNLIVRYLRIRMGAAYPSDLDACAMANGANMIFDHCSMTWGKDECFSINPDGKGTAPKNITIQKFYNRAGFAESLVGGLMQTDISNGCTIFRNLYIDNKTRNRKLKD